MANQLLTPKIYANVMLKLLKNELVMGKMVTTQFNDMFKKVGQTVYVKRPPQFVTRQGAVAQVQDVIVGEQPVTLDRQRGIDIEFSSIEETLTVDQLLKSEIMQSEAATLAQTIDGDLMAAVLEFPNWVGTPGSTIDSPGDFFLAPKRLDMLAVPGNMRNGVLSPDDYWATAASFLPATFFDNNINRDALSRAKLPLLGNVQPYMTQNVINLVNGTRASTAAGAINGANQNVTYASVANSYTQTLILDGFAAGATIAAGEVFNIANVYAVNPRSKAKLPFLAQFVNLVAATADGGGNVTLTIANPIIVGGAYATVDSAPADNALLTFMGAAGGIYPQNAVFHKSSIALCFAKLVTPRSGLTSYATDPETGISIRYWQTSDGTNDTHLHRWDVLYGVTNVDRRLGTRVSGT